MTKNTNKEFGEQIKLEKAGGTTIIRCPCGKVYATATGRIRNYTNSKMAYLYVETRDKNDQDIKDFKRRKAMEKTSRRF